MEKNVDFMIWKTNYYIIQNGEIQEKQPTTNALHVRKYREQQAAKAKQPIPPPVVLSGLDLDPVPVLESVSILEPIPVIRQVLVIQ